MFFWPWQDGTFVKKLYITARRPAPTLERTPPMASYLNTIGMKLRSQAVVVICCCCTESLQSLRPSQEAPRIPSPDPVPSHSLSLYNETRMWGCGRDVEEEHMVCLHKHMPHWWNQTFQGNAELIGVLGSAADWCHWLSVRLCSTFTPYVALSFPSCTRAPNPGKSLWKEGARRGNLSIIQQPVGVVLCLRWSVMLWLSSAAF